MFPANRQSDSLTRFGTASSLHTLIRICNIANSAGLLLGVHIYAHQRNRRNARALVYENIVVDFVLWDTQQRNTFKMYVDEIRLHMPLRVD
jgi:hypothetical protein